MAPLVFPFFPIHTSPSEKRQVNGPVDNVPYATAAASVTDWLSVSHIFRKPVPLCIFECSHRRILNDSIWLHMTPFESLKFHLACWRECRSGWVLGWDELMWSTAQSKNTVSRPISCIISQNFNWLHVPSRWQPKQIGYTRHTTSCLC